VTEPYRKKLIEVALPLAAINRESAREKAIRHGHPSTLHLWWARRPLSACRAVLFASIVDDPSSRTDLFPTEEAQEAERQRLFRLIEELVTWENLNNERVLASAREEILKATEGNPPPVLDPFCGGGSIPLEAQRLGLEAHASDLNPVAVLITKALIEIPPKFAGNAPINPEASAKLGHGASWSGAQGIAEDVRYYARWMRDRAAERIAHLYPTAELPDGTAATVIAWLWGRTVICPNPDCRATMTLLNGTTLSRRRGHEAFLVPRIEDSRVTFAISSDRGSSDAGTVGRTGARCLVCEQPAPLAHVRAEALAGRMGSQLLCVVTEGNRKRHYVEATSEHELAASVPPPEDAPTSDLPESALGFRVQGYGITRHDQLFSPRQLNALSTFSELVGAARDKSISDGASPEYADALAVYLTLAIGRLANRCSSQSFWNPNGEKVEQVFARNALPMIWVFAEANPFSDSSGNFLGQVDYLVAALEGVPARGTGVVRQLDAASLPDDKRAHVVTDPPYYDNVPYADLSDFFYVWLRRSGTTVLPDVFSTVLVPKSQELIAEPARHGGKRPAAKFFEEGMRSVFERLRKIQVDGFPAAVFYAFKQSEENGDGSGRASTGWETMLEGLVRSGFEITGTWPMRTEQPGGLREHGRNSLASSVVIVCRPRAVEAPMTTRGDFIRLLRAELPGTLRSLQRANIAPVDLAQAAIGPGMAIYSRYSRIREATDSTMGVRDALALINQVLDEILAEQEGEFDSDTRFAISWFEEHGNNEGPFGDAETLAKAKNVSVRGLVEAGIMASRAPKVRLVGRDELRADWDPAADDRLTIWEVTQHLIRRLEVGGEIAAADLLRRVGAVAESARDLAYRLYTISERKSWAQEALGYNALVVSWPEIARLAAEHAMGSAQQSLGV